MYKTMGAESLMKYNSLYDKRYGLPIIDIKTIICSYIIEFCFRFESSRH